jgi:hypothetical protein
MTNAKSAIITGTLGDRVECGSISVSYGRTGPFCAGRWLSRALSRLNVPGLTSQDSPRPALREVSCVDGLRCVSEVSQRAETLSID